MSKVCSINLGWIGTGILGRAIIKELLGSGINVIIYNRTVNKTNELINCGATLANNIDDLFLKSNIIFTCLGNSEAFNNLILSRIKKLNINNEKKTIIDLGTISPESAIDNARLLRSCMMNYIECPVSGGPEGAANRTMTAICAGDKDIFSENHQILRIFCTNIHYVGEHGNAQKLKIINNLAESINLLCASEVILLGTKLGFKISTLRDILTTARGKSTYMDLLLERLYQNINEPTVTLDIRTKDLALAESLLNKNNFNSTLSFSTIKTFKKVKTIYGPLEDQSKCYDLLRNT